MIKNKLDGLLSSIPNLPLSDVPIGTDENSNKEVSKSGTINKFNFEPTFPYTTIKHRNHTDSFNYSSSVSQSDLTINSGNYKRNVTHLGLNETFRNYPLLADPLASQVKLKVDGVKSSDITGISLSLIHI